MKGFAKLNFQSTLKVIYKKLQNLQNLTFKIYFFRFQKFIRAIEINPFLYVIFIIFNELPFVEDGKIAFYLCMMTCYYKLNIWSKNQGRLFAIICRPQSGSLKIEPQSPKKLNLKQFKVHRLEIKQKTIFRNEKSERSIRYHQQNYVAMIIHR